MSGTRLSGPVKQWAIIRFYQSAFTLFRETEERYKFQNECERHLLIEPTTAYSGRRSYTVSILNWTMHKINRVRVKWYGEDDVNFYNRRIFVYETARIAEERRKFVLSDMYNGYCETKFLFHDATLLDGKIARISKLVNSAASVHNGD